MTDFSVIAVPLNDNLDLVCAPFAGPPIYLQVETHERHRDLSVEWGVGRPPVFQRSPKHRDAELKAFIRSQSRLVLSRSYSDHDFDAKCLELVQAGYWPIDGYWRDIRSSRFKELARQQLMCSSTPATPSVWKLLRSRDDDEPARETCVYRLLQLMEGLLRKRAREVVGATGPSVEIYVSPYPWEPPRGFYLGDKLRLDLRLAMLPRAFALRAITQRLWEIGTTPTERRDAYDASSINDRRIDIRLPYVLGSLPMMWQFADLPRQALRDAFWFEPQQIDRVASQWARPSAAELTPAGPNTEAPVAFNQTVCSTVPVTGYDAVGNPVNAPTVQLQPAP